MYTALLLHAYDWEAFYIDQYLVSQGHRVDREFLVNTVIRHQIKLYVEKHANNDTPDKDDELVTFWYAPVDEGETVDEAWQYGWWQFPDSIDDTTWKKLTT